MLLTTRVGVTNAVENFLTIFEWHCWVSSALNEVNTKGL
jgi:hypothetical protein